MSNLRGAAQASEEDVREIETWYARRYPILANAQGLGLVPKVNILHSTTNPPLLQRLKEMLGSSARADIAVGYPFDRLRASFFISGFEQTGNV